MNDFAGPVALALVGLWVAYLVPHKLRYRQQLLESRADDRFSDALRVVAVTERRRSRGRGAHARTADPSEGTTSSRGPGLLTPGTGLPALQAGGATGGTTVDRPTATETRITADAARRAAQARAARAAALARRGAAARRRGVLAAVLTVATVAGWTVAGMTSVVTWVAGAVPTVLLGTVVVLGRRAVLAGRAADAEWEARLAEQARTGTGPRTGAIRTVAPASGATPTVRTAAPARPATATAPAEAPHALVTGRAVHPSDARTEVFSRIVADQGETESTPARHAHSGATPVVRKAVATRFTTGDDTATAATEAAAEPAATDEDAWSPVPVPRPTYTMKATAPRRDPAPLENLEGSTAAAPTSSATDADAPAAAPEQVEPVAETTGSIDLNAVLAKRRAAGE